MATIDLHALMGDEFVLHFGGRPKEVNAHTFANSLLSISEALREINSQINPDFSLEIVIDAVGTGSFRARVKASGTRITGLFKGSAHQVLVGVLAAIIYDKAFSPDMQIVVHDDSYIVQKGRDRIVLPKAVYEAKERLRNTEEIEEHISRAFEVLEEDPSITEFGFTPSLTDDIPLANIPRDSFAVLSATPAVKPPDDSHRTKFENADLVVVRAVLERGPRKWQFVWNGIRIAAPIKDSTFFDRLARHEYEFGQGDLLHVVLAIHQTKDEMSGAFINDKYEVVEVKGRTQGPRQTSFPSL